MSDRSHESDVRLSDSHDWLVGNYGPRCTLVSAVSILRLLGAQGDPKHLVEILEQYTGWKEHPSWRQLIRFWRSYLRRLDRGIEAAARAGGIEVKSRTKFIFGFKAVAQALNRKSPVMLNCYYAPSGSFSHSVVGFGFNEKESQLLTLDPNDSVERWTSQIRKICSITIIEPEPKPKRG